MVEQEAPLRTLIITNFSFIGSAKVGWYLRSKLAAVTRCAMEHRGVAPVAPVVMTADADIESAIPSLAKGGFYHAGQVCVSVQRLFVHQSIVRVVADKLAVAAQNMFVGNPLSDKTEVGPLIRAGEVDRVTSWVQEAVDAGTEVLCGGETLQIIVMHRQCYLIRLRTVKYRMQKYLVRLSVSTHMIMLIKPLQRRIASMWLSKPQSIVQISISDVYC